MPPKPRIGQYRHTPAVPLESGPDGTLRPAMKRRRFPQRGMVPLVYALLGPLACAGMTLLLQAMFGRRYLPDKADGTPWSPSPRLDNVLFEAGAIEVALASALVGWWLFQILWNTPSPRDSAWHTARGAFRGLVGRALLLGPLLTLVAMPIGIIGRYVRTGPADQPVLVRPFFGALAAIPVMVMSLLSILPLVMLVLGLLLGLGTAAAVAVLWQHYPEEPVFK